MSVNKITELLQNHSMIDYNLISDSLSSILKEICQIITDQSQEIDSIKKQIPSLAVKNEVEQKIKLQADATNNVQAGLNNLCQITQQKLETVAQTIQSSVDNSNKQYSDLKEQLDIEMSDKIAEIQGNLLVATKQIKEAQDNIDQQKIQIEENQQRIKDVNDFIHNGEDQTVEVVSAKLEQLTEKVNKMEEESQNDRNSLHTSINEIKDNMDKENNETKTEIELIEKDLKAVRSIVVDTPSIDFDGAVDTEVVVRAIQRDSRRIDSFNETINAIREENNLIKFFFSEMAQCIQKIQLNMLDFVSEHNKTKKEILILNNDNTQRCKALKNNFFTCSSNIQYILEATLNGMNLISNTFNQVFSFLGKVTSRPLPLFGDFDDTLLEFQKLSDQILAQNEKNEEMNKQEEKKSPRNIPDKPFKIEAVQLPDVSQLLNQRFSAISRFDSKKKEEPVKMVGSGIDVELRQDVQNIKSQINESLETVNHLRDTIELKIENKADSVAMERMTEKIRGMVLKLRDQINSQGKSLSNCILRNEAETLIKHVLSTSGLGGETAAGANHVECLMCGRSKSSITPSAPGCNCFGGNLPKLSSSVAGSVYSNNPYELMYGKSPEKRTAFTCTQQTRSINSHPERAGLKGPANLSLNASSNIKSMARGYQFKNT